MRLILCGSLLLTALFAMNLRADIITLADGRTIEGEIVSEDATEIVVKSAVGKTTIKREEIQSIDKRKSVSAIYREKITALEKSKNNESKDEWVALAGEAQRKGASLEATMAYKHVMEIDPNDTAARNALGYVRSGGAWILKSDVKAKNAGDKPVKDAETASPMSKEKLAASMGLNSVSSSDEKPVNCPRCNGTGIWILLPCLNCNKSDKPGYKRVSSGYELDSRCGGTGKLVGAYCELCNKTGKVMMSHLTPANGGNKQPPAGRLWCPVCNGTGIEKYTQCNQCKRSKWPGYLFFGDRVMECNNCLGAGKIATLVCAHCNKTGLVPATQSDPNKQYGIGVGPEKK